jgi:protein gp37
MSNDNGNGQIPNLEQIMAGVKPVQVVQGVVQTLQTALDQARRGQISGVIVIGVSAENMASMDAIWIENIALAVMAIGAAEIAIAKITETVRHAQQQTAVPKIVRPGPGVQVR